MKKLRTVVGLVASVIVANAASAHANVVAEWNAVAVQCIAVGVTGNPASRPGPPALLDLALVHAAMHDAVQAIEGRFEPYLAAPPATGKESVAAAAAAAAHRVLSTVCPTFQASLDAAFKPYLDGGDPGLQVGYAAGDALLVERRDAAPPAFTPGTIPGKWRPTPPGNAAFAFLALAATKPFTFDEPSKFRAPEPPRLESWKYLRDFNEVKHVGAVESHPAAGVCPAPGKDRRCAVLVGQFHLAMERDGPIHRPGPAAVDRRCGPAPGAREPRDRGCDHQRVGEQAPLQLLAADHGHPRGG